MKVGALLSGLLRAGHAGASEDSPGRRTRTSIDYGVFAGMLQVRDDVLRPLRWTGVVSGLALGLDVETRRFVHRLDLDLGMGRLWNRYGHGGLVIAQGLHYALGAQAFATRRVSMFALLAYRYESLDAYYFDWDDSFLYWFTLHSLAPGVGFETRLSRSASLLTTIELPVVALMSRPPTERWYKVDPLPYLTRWPELANRGLEVAGPSDVFAPTLRARLDKAYGRHFGARVTLEVAYRRALEPRGYFALSERLVGELRHEF
jgi:hypothetical protein